MNKKQLIVAFAPWLIAFVVAFIPFGKFSLRYIIGVLALLSIAWLCGFLLHYVYYSPKGWKFKDILKKYIKDPTKFWLGG